MNKNIKKVRVRKDFPGFKENDVLGINGATGLFEYLYNDTVKEDTSEDYPVNAIGSVFKELAVNKPTLSKDQVLDNMEYFLDITDYIMQSQEWVFARIVELRGFIDKLDEDEKEGIVPENVNVKEAKTVWQNSIWELEVVAGIREPIRSDYI
jgi:hypothetical protein